MLAAEERGDRGHRRRRAGILARRHQAGEPARALAIDLRLRKARPLRDVREQIERRAGVAPRAIRSRRRSSPSTTRRRATRRSARRASAMASAFRLSVPCSSIAAVKLARPGRSDGIRVAAGLQHERGRRHGHARALLMDHREAVRQRERLRRRQRHGERRTGRRADPCATAHRRSRLRRRCRPPPSASAASARTAPRSGSPGTPCTTTRAVGFRYCSANALIAAGVSLRCSSRYFGR